MNDRPDKPLTTWLLGFSLVALAGFGIATLLPYFGILKVTDRREKDFADRRMAYALFSRAAKDAKEPPKGGTADAPKDAAKDAQEADDRIEATADRLEEVFESRLEQDQKN